MKTIITTICLLLSANLFAVCFDLEKPLQNLSVNGVRGRAMAILPYEAVKACLKSSNGFMGNQESKTWTVELLDKEGYQAAVFSQNPSTPSEVVNGRCGGICKTLSMDFGKFFNGRSDEVINSHYFPLNIQLNKPFNSAKGTIIFFKNFK